MRRRKLIKLESEHEEYKPAITRIKVQLLLSQNKRFIIAPQIIAGKIMNEYYESREIEENDKSE